MPEHAMMNGSLHSDGHSSEEQSIIKVASSKEDEGDKEVTPLFELFAPEAPEAAPMEETFNQERINKNNIDEIREQMAGLREEVERLKIEQELAFERKIMDEYHENRPYSRHCLPKDYDEHPNDSGGNSEGKSYKLVKDIFSLMMTSTDFKTWFIGIVTFIFQCAIGSLLILEAYELCPLHDAEEMQCLPFGIPLQISVKATIAQYMTVLIIVYAQSDVLTSIYTMILLSGPFHSNHYRNSWFHKIFSEAGFKNDDWSFRFIHVLLPNVLKCVQGFLILIATFLVIIIRSETIIDLLRDFTVLLVISEADNILFSLANRGNLGAALQRKAKRLEETRFRVNERTSKIAKRVDLFLEVVLSSALLGILTYIVVSQYNGTYMRMMFPNCEADEPRLIGDGTCDTFAPYNTAECGFDGGDCI